MLQGLLKPEKLNPHASLLVELGLGHRTTVMEDPLALGLGVAVCLTVVVIWSHTAVYLSAHPVAFHTDKAS